MEKINYDNYKMYHPDGTLMCFCSKKKANWYKDRNLANIENNNVYLLFSPNGFGEPDILLEGRDNVCVISGEKDNLTKHHVVPYLYRKYFSLEYKDKNSLDIVLLTRNIHNEYEAHANTFKLLLESKYTSNNSDLNIKQKNQDFIEIRKYYNILNNNNIKLPPDKEVYMNMRIGGILEKYNITIDKVLKTKTILENLYINDIITDIGIKNLIILWKLHFLKYGKPKYLPTYWKPNIIKTVKKNGYNTKKSDLETIDIQNNKKLIELIKKYDLYETAKLYF